MGPDGEPLLLRSQRGLNTPELQQELERTSGQTTNAYINYAKDFGDHSFAIMAGTEKQVSREINFRDSATDIFHCSRRAFAGTQMPARMLPTDVDRCQIIYRTRLNYFGRINIAREKYLVEMVWRYDASYIFPENNRWGFFRIFSRLGSSEETHAAGDIR